MSDKDKLNLIKENDFNGVIHASGIAKRANDIIQKWHDKEKAKLEVGYCRMIDGCAYNIGPSRVDDDTQIITYKLELLEEKKECGLDHHTVIEMQKAAIRLTEAVFKYNGSQIKINIGKCPECKEELK